MDKQTINQILNDHPNLREKLFARGFLLTDDRIDENGYPFFGQWESNGIGRFTVYTARGMKCYVFCAEDESLALIGHAYDPFSGQSREEDILRSLWEAKQCGEDSFWALFNQLTGIFTLFLISDDLLWVIGDASGMQTTFYTVSQGHIYVSSHTNLLGDILSLAWDPYVRELSRYRFFGLLGNALPGDITQFPEVKRLVPNHYVSIDACGHITAKRFFFPRRLPVSLDHIVENTAAVMQSNMRLIAEKWARPAISLTGGCDSKTTLACTNGLYDKYSYFSYISSGSEEPDAIAAGKICDELGLKHTIYRIPDDDAALPNTDAVNQILFMNNGSILPSKPNDVRKRIFFANTTDFDVEVKSWASEIGRAYYSKRFNGRTDFGSVPTPRKCTTLYKFFLHNRKLVKMTDAVFETYLADFFAQSKENPIEWQEQFFWEFRVPSWNGLVITGEHRYSYDITIPYNNRRILELLLSAPIEARIHDTVYTDIRKRMNPRIDATGIAVTNLKHTQRRAKMEDLYYSLHTSEILL